jgi:hypothetical protein
MIDNSGYKVLIEVDGGIDISNAARLVGAGVNVLVAGNSVFSSADPTETIRKLKSLEADFHVITTKVFLTMKHSKVSHLYPLWLLAAVSPKGAKTLPFHVFVKFLNSLK